ncbi:hypothetical protein BU23DRAFT_658121, partial [Bimuria novae-zelandiae CBS 107.79]
PTFPPIPATPHTPIYTKKCLLIAGSRTSTRYKNPKKKKTQKRDLTAVERAFAVGASMHSMGTNKEIAALFDPPTTKDAIAKLVRRIRDRADQEGISITNPTLYETLPGRGRPELLDDAQKKRIIEIVTQDRAHREKEPLQAIKDGDFDELPPMSVSTFENVMYEAGYARRKPGWKPPLTEQEMQDRYKWALAHNPDRYKEGDNLGFNFRKCVYTDETPARIDEQRGMQRAWFLPDEKYHLDVKHNRVQKYCKLQFYGAFTYNHKGPCYIYGHEKEDEKVAAEAALARENAERRKQATSAQYHARAALQEIDPNDRNLRSRKHQYTKKDNYTRRA